MHAVLSARLGMGKSGLHFAPEEALQEVLYVSGAILPLQHCCLLMLTLKLACIVALLQVALGSVSPLAVANPEANQVGAVARQASWCNASPLRMTGI